MAFPRLNRFWAVYQLDRQFRQLGWWPGTYLWNFYRGRLRDHLPGKPSTLKVLRSRHGITQRYVPLTLRIEPGGSDLVTLEGVWLHQDYYHPALEGVETILDIGGNIGMSALWFNEWLKPKGYACVEPDPRNLLVLQKNIETNGLQVKVFPCAATSEPGRIRLSMGLSFGCSHLEGINIDDGLHQTEQLVEIEGRAIPSMLDELGWAKVDLIKIDIEGGEQDLLRHCSAWIDRVGQMVMEIHGNTSPEEIQSFLPAPWELERIGKGSEPTYRAYRR